MAGTDSTSSSNPPTLEPLVLLNLHISTKLNRTNFLAWQSQIVPILHGYDLFKYVDSSSPPPPTVPAGTTVQLNPSYVHWHKRDQLLLGWIRSSLYEPLLAQVVSYTTSSSLWMTLHTTFSAASRARLLELQSQLQDITKGGSTYAEYILRLRAIADELAFVDAPVSYAELVSYTLCGLGSDFNPLVLAVNARFDPISLSDFHSLLLTTETRLNSQNQPPSLHAVSDHPAAFYANQRTCFPNPNPRQFNPNSFRNQGARPPRTFPRPNLNPIPRPNNPFPQPNNPAKPTNPLQFFPPRPPAPNFSHQLTDGSPCQICGRPNHQARQCYHRFENRYLDPILPSTRGPPYQAFVAQPSSFSAPHE